MSSEWAARHPISLAACNGTDTALRVLLFDESGTRREEVKVTALDALDEEGRAAIHYSSWNGLLGTTRALLEAGASVDVRSADRQSTPLHFACGMGHPEVVACLLLAGADMNAIDCDKWTPMDLAKQNLFGNTEGVQAIVDLLNKAVESTK